MRGNDISWAGIRDFTLGGDKKPVKDCEIADFETALKLYSEGSYIEASTPLWEKMRMAFLESGRKELWDNTFDKAQGFAKAAFLKSSDARKLEKRLDVGEAVFLADLPCIGAAMERLEYQDWQDMFYNRALEIYNSGYWICGYKDGKFVICGDWE